MQARELLTREQEGGTPSIVSLNYEKSPMFLEKIPGPRILIVDDEPLIRWSLSETLATAGFRTLEAGDGRMALRQMDGEEGDVDLVLLDLKLPDVDGLSLLKQIKQRRPQCPVVLMTAYGTPEILDEAVRCGAALVTQKPFNVDDMPSLVRKLLAA